MSAGCSDEGCCPGLDVRASVEAPDCRITGEGARGDVTFINLFQDHFEIELQARSNDCAHLRFNDVPVLTDTFRLKAARLRKSTEHSRRLRLTIAGAPGEDHQPGQIILSVERRVVEASVIDSVEPPLLLDVDVSTVDE